MKRHRSELIEALTPYAGMRVDGILFDSHIREVYRLYDDLCAAFSSAGWTVRHSWLAGGFRIHGAGVVVGIAGEANPQESPPWTTDDVTPFRVQVGVKTATDL